MEWHPRGGIRCTALHRRRAAAERVGTVLDWSDLTGAAVCGDHLVTERREVLRQFANGIDATTRRVHRAFLASVRVLGEGVDITGERGLDAICFADTRGSQVEIVQPARIVVPVFLEPNEDPTYMVASASFRPLVAVLQGLRSHDDRLVEQLASRALTSGKRKVHVPAGPGRTDRRGQRGGREPGGRHRRGGRVGAAALLLAPGRGHNRRVPAHPRLPTRVPGLARGLPGPPPVAEGNGITGSTPSRTTPRPRPASRRRSPLGRRVHQQRKALRAGELEDWRKELPDAPEAGIPPARYAASGCRRRPPLPRPRRPDGRRRGIG